MDKVQNAKKQLVDEVKAAIVRHYDTEGDTYSEKLGCYVNGSWLSVEKILGIIDKVAQQ